MPLPQPGNCHISVLNPGGPEQPEVRVRGVATHRLISPERLLVGFSADDRLVSSQQLLSGRCHTKSSAGTENTCRVTDADRKTADYPSDTGGVFNSVARCFTRLWVDGWPREWVDGSWNKSLSADTSPLSTAAAYVCAQIPSDIQ